MFKPRLHLELKSSVGVYSSQNLEDGIAHARYYHLRVTNQATFPTATDVQVLFLGVESVDDKERRPGDLYVPLPLGWANGLHPLARPIGSKTQADADLLFVREDMLRFVPVVVPNNFQSTYSGKSHLRVTAIARGIDAESNPLQLDIRWDGEWERDDDAMAKHFVVAAV
jgi:hypothetical protein